MIHSHDLYNRVGDSIIMICTRSDDLVIIIFYNRADDSVLNICITELMIHSHYDLYNRADDSVIMISIAELMINSHYDLYNRSDDSQSLWFVKQS